jgi:hypothetical protein
VEVLIPEARQHQRRRYVRTGVDAALGAFVVAALVVGAVVLLGGPDANGRSRTSPGPVSVGAGDHAVLIPALCFASAYTAVAQQPSDQLPSCAAQSALIAAALGVTPAPLSGGTGYYSSTPPDADVGFAHYPSTLHDQPGSTVLLNGLARGSGPVERYVLGPAAMRLPAFEVTTAVVH